MKSVKKEYYINLNLLLQFILICFTKENCKNNFN